MLLETKKKLHAKCLELIEEQLTSAQTELKKIREMEAEETKSSAGDKYETTRAMLFQEKEKISIRLDEMLKKQKTLHQVNSEKKLERGGLGALIKTSNGFFYLSVSLGQVVVDDCTYFAISPVAPIGKLVTGKAVGDSVKFMNTTHEILDLI